MTWDELSQAIRTIESATKPDEASAAYALGCNVNRSSIKLQDTYMKKQLKLGRPDLASIPAQQLTTLDPKNGIAWGDLSYVVVKRGPTGYLLALTDGLKAIDLDPENPGICQDVAQLVAWYGANKAKLAALDPDSAAILKKLMDGSLSQEYTKDAKDAKDAYSQFDKDREVRKKEADAADAEVKKLDAKFKQLGETYKAKGKAYDTAVQKISTIQDQLATARKTSPAPRATANPTARLPTSGTSRTNSATPAMLPTRLKRTRVIRRSRASRSRRNWTPSRRAAKLDKRRFHRRAARYLRVGASGSGRGHHAGRAGRGRQGPRRRHSRPRRRHARRRVGPDRPQAAEAEAGDMLDRAKLGADSKDDGMRTMAKNLLADNPQNLPQHQGRHRSQGPGRQNAVGREGKGVRSLFRSTPHAKQARKPP